MNEKVMRLLLAFMLVVSAGITFTLISTEQTQAAQAIPECVETPVSENWCIIQTGDTNLVYTGVSTVPDFYSTYNVSAPTGVVGDAVRRQVGCFNADGSIYWFTDPEEGDSVQEYSWKAGEVSLYPLVFRDSFIANECEPWPIEVSPLYTPYAAAVGSEIVGGNGLTIIKVNARFTHLPEDPPPSTTSTSTTTTTIGGTGGGPGRFDDVPIEGIFFLDIEALAESGITRGCNPPANNLFCPNSTVTRGQMAAFLHRALPDLPLVREAIDFTDDDDSVFEADIEWLYSRGVTQGTSATTYSPNKAVTRGQMAAFLVRALKYVDDGGGNLFVDDDTSIFEGDIDRLGTAGVTRGCNPPTNDRFCPNQAVTRSQMAAFLVRALGL